MGQKKSAFEKQLNADDKKKEKANTAHQKRDKWRRAQKPGQMFKCMEGKKALKPVQSSTLKTEQRTALTKREVC